MRDSRRAGRRLWAAFGVLVLAFTVSDGLLIGVAHAQGDDALAANYGIYNGQVAATADREQVGSTLDAGFTSGMVNNFYPLARDNVANAGTSAAASPADTGPFAQAVFAGLPPCANPPACAPSQQPQYVYAQSPGSGNPQPFSQGSATASASATPASATAAGTYGTVANPSAPADGSDGGTASTASYFDAAHGFVTVGDSRVHHASYGAGVLVIDQVHVGVTVSTNGTSFAKTISITVGGASVAGQPVTIDQNGITVTHPILPLDTPQSATDKANQALAAAGLSVHTVAPQVSQDGTDLHVDAVGVVVNQQNVGGSGGIPSQFVIHTLGEVVLDNEATPAPPPSSQLPLGNGSNGTAGSSIPGSSSTTVISGSGSTTGGTGSTSTTSSGGSQKPTGAGVSPLLLVQTQPRARWLLLAYFAWQALMVALAGSLYLRRTALRRTA